MSNGLNGSTPRRRRSASEARDAILEAAEGILIERAQIQNLPFHNPLTF